MRRVLGSVFVTILVFFAPLRAQEPYLKPPAVVEKILDAPQLPALIPSPDSKSVLLAEPTAAPSIADMAQPMLRLAGLRINPNTNGPHQPLGFRGLVLRDLASSTERRLAPPGGAPIPRPPSSPHGRFTRFTTT